MTGYRYIYASLCIADYISVHMYSCAMEQLIASTIHAACLSVDPNSLKSLFDDFGVKQPSDVSLLCEGDFVGLLKTVESRKVIAYFKSLDNLTQPSTESVEVPCTSASSVVIGLPVCTVRSPCGRLPTPYHFPLHSISGSLQAAVNNGEHLQSGQRSQLLDAIYQDVTKFTL